MDTLYHRSGRLTLVFFWAAAPLFLQNAHILNPARHEEFTGSIWIEDGRIREVVRAPSGVPAAFHGERVDLTGKWVIPGLNDMHTHAWGNPSPVSPERSERPGIDGSARIMARAGVTGFLDVGSPEKRILSLRDRQREGRELADGAAIHAAGPVFIESRKQVTGDDPGARLVASPADAREQFRELTKRHPDVIKLIYDDVGDRHTMGTEVMRTLIGESRAHGYKTVVHIGTWVNAERAIRAGATAITHLYNREQITDSLAREWARRGVYSIPTISQECGMYRIDRDARELEDPLLKALTAPDLLESYREKKSYSEKAQYWVEWQERSCGKDLRSLARLYRAGVPLMTGADTGNLGVFQGWSVHRELEYFVEAGIPAWDALAAATTVPARFLGERLGIEAGDIANLVVLGASPVGDIRNTRKIERVYLRGEIVR